MDQLKFPRGFVWGAATSAHQIEGAAQKDGRGESIWDRYAAAPGNIEDGSNASVACDHYHRWRDDIALMKNLGLNAYRFSIAWPRILPLGTGQINPPGLDFYDALVDGLLEAGITPFPTLYHWDLPQALEDKGGWGARATAEAFAEYTQVVARRLGDRVKNWTTHNEPWCVATLGYEEGKQAPGHTDPALALRAAHHLLLSHGLAADILRQHVPDAKVGIVLNLTPSKPATQSERDQDASRKFDGLFNRWYLDPLFRGKYPEDAIADRVRWGHLNDADLPFVWPGDMKHICRPLDFLGVNYYSHVVIRAKGENEIEGVPTAPKDELTDMGWEVHPAGMRELLLRVYHEYAPPKIYITENGAAYGEGPDTLGRIRDDRRIAFLKGHLTAAHQAISAGVPLCGYFAWSLLDNFEWSHGYEKRFGLHWVDYDTQQRLPKDSALWYQGAIRANAIDGVPQLTI